MNGREQDIYSPFGTLGNIRPTAPEIAIITIPTINGISAPMIQGFLGRFTGYLVFYRRSL